ncbi:MAG TPA: pantetheine-phosphate adenylyltransferase [bacterium]|nr:pantetheine-phosphate adenylyltransferase [bacterium]HPP88698.1 pantetheine-phosphate adenylyltransferase [bacterium]
MKNTIIYPGTFDPITYGHIDIIHRAANIFEKVIIGIIESPLKTNFWFSIGERREMVELAIKDFKNVRVQTFNGLLVDFAKSLGVNLVVRGLRAITDFEYEFQMALTNKKLEDEIETIFMMTNEKYSYLSSSVVKEISKFGGDISQFVPEFVADRVFKKLQK